MRLDYETDYRPNYELMLCINWLVCGLLCTAAMIFYSGFPVGLTLLMTGAFFVIAGYQAVFARSRYERMQKLERQELNFVTIADLEEEMEENALVVGHGFEWGGRQAQQVYDLYRDHELLAEIREQHKGATFLHGIGIANEKKIVFPDQESKGHVHICGTTGAGKTRLFEILIIQCILRGEPVIIIDPKGDHELKNNVEAAYRRLGLGHKFSFFHPAFVDESAAINPLASRQRSTEIASRLAAIIPTGKGGEVFKDFSQNALMSIFYAVEMSVRNPTIMDVQRALSEGFGPLCVKALEGWAYDHDLTANMKSAMMTGSSANSRKTHSNDDLEAMAKRGARFYQTVSAQDHRLDHAEMNNLIALLLHDPDHFRKMVASLVPVVGKLCAGPLATLLSPDREAGRVPKSGKIISLRQVVETGGGVYIGLDTLSDKDVGRAVGQLIEADLTSLSGKRYNFGRENGRFVNIFIDEASEITNEELIQLLNKGRGAGFRVFVATQTMADYEAALGSKAEAEKLTGNMNTTFMLRTKNVNTQKMLSDALPEVPISYVMKTTGSSMGDKSHAGAFAVNHGERLMSEDRPLVAPQSFGELSDLEFFVQFARGNVVKGRLPIVIAPDNPFDPSEGELRARHHHQSPASNPDAGFDVEPHARPEKPPLIQMRDGDEFDDQLHPGRRRFLPRIRWIDVLPGFRPGDKLPEPLPDPYIEQCARDEARPSFFKTEDIRESITQ